VEKTSFWLAEHPKISRRCRRIKSRWRYMTGNKPKTIEKLCFWTAKTGYPHYPQFRNPPKVDEKTKQNRAFSKCVHKLSTKLSTFWVNYPLIFWLRIFAKKGAEIHNNHYIIQPSKMECFYR